MSPFIFELFLCHFRTLLKNNDYDLFLNDHKSTPSSSCLSWVSLTIKIVSFNMRTCLCYPNTHTDTHTHTNTHTHTHTHKTWNCCSLLCQVILVCMHTALVKVPEVLEKAKKGYHFKAKLLPKRILTLGASQHASTKTYSSTLWFLRLHEKFMLIC